MCKSLQEDSHLPCTLFQVRWVHHIHALLHNMDVDPVLLIFLNQVYFSWQCKRFWQLGTFLNTIKRILDILHCRVEDILKSWASCLPSVGDKKSLFGEQMNGVTVLLRTKYKNYLQAIVEQLVSNVSVFACTLCLMLTQVA